MSRFFPFRAEPNDTLECADSFTSGTWSFEEDRYTTYWKAQSERKDFDIFKNAKVQLESVYMDDTTSDVTFVCGPEDCQHPETIPAHKLILAMQSPVFKTMFFGSMPEKPIVRITDVTADSFKEFLDIFYKNDINPTIENAPEVIYLLKKYELNGLMDVYSNFLQRKLSVDQIDQGLELAIKFDLLKLQDFCGSKIVQSLKDSNESEAFVCCSKNALRTIMQSEELKQYGREIFLGCFEWARNTLKCENGTKNEPTLSEIRSQIGDFDLIEFGTMDCETLIMILYEFNNFFTRKDLANIHTILAMKYPVKRMKLDELNELNYELDRAKSSKQHYITEDDVISFQFSKKVFFSGYQYAQILHNTWDTPYNLWLTLTKISSDPDKQRDIVLLRETLTTSIALQNETNKRKSNEIITIEPNVTYELRIKPSIRSDRKFYTEYTFAVNMCEPEDDMVSIQGFSPVISALQFQCPLSEKP